MASRFMTVLLLLLAGANLSIQAPIDDGFPLLSPLNLLIRSPPLEEITRTTIPRRSGAAGAAAAFVTNTYSLDCNLEGSPSVDLGLLDTLDPDGIYNVLECQVECDNNSTCQSYSWDINQGGSSGGICSLYSGLLLPGTIVSGNTGVFYYGKGEYVGDEYGCFSWTDIVIPQTTPDGMPTFTYKWTRDCNIEGSPTAALGPQYHFPETNKFDCQARCEYVRGCESYAFNTTAPKRQQCVWYNKAIDPDVTPGAVTYGSTGVFFSDRNPANIAGACYDSTPPIVPPQISEAESGTNISAWGTIALKDWVSDCFVQCSPTAQFESLQHFSTSDADIMACQWDCRWSTPCRSWSWNTSAPAGSRCVQWVDYLTSGSNGVIPGNTGVYFSDKGLVDGTDFCLSSSYQENVTYTNGTYIETFIFPSPNAEYDVGGADLPKYSTITFEYT